MSSDLAKVDVSNKSYVGQICNLPESRVSLGIGQITNLPTLSLDFCRKRHGCRSKSLYALSPSGRG